MSLGDIIQAVMQMRESMRADGAEEREIEAATERSVRSSWPFTREWKYLCQQCSDYGLVMHECPGDATCGRHKPHLAHEFGKPCWCSLGQRFKARPKTETDFQEAGKMKKPDRSFTRAGR